MKMADPGQFKGGHYYFLSLWSKANYPGNYTHETRSNKKAPAEMSASALGTKSPVLTDVRCVYNALVLSPGTLSISLL